MKATPPVALSIFASAMGLFAATGCGVQSPRTPEPRYQEAPLPPWDRPEAAEMGPDPSALEGQWVPEDEPEPPAPKKSLDLEDEDSQNTSTVGDERATVAAPQSD